MKSKKAKLLLIAIVLLLTGGWAWWQLKPKPKDIFTDQEISIKQAQIPDVDLITYQDWSGFRFEYPNLLTIKEVELENPEIYSSLEVAGNDGKRLTVRIADTAIANLTDWQKDFNRQNSVRKIDQTILAGLTALRLRYGAPEMTLTVAIDNGIIYQVESLADDGFWDRTHEDLIDSWQFTNTAEPAAVPPGTGTGESDTITLIEEILE